MTLSRPLAQRADCRARAVRPRDVFLALSSPRAEMVFRRGEAGDPSTFDPQKTSTVIEADAIYDLFEGLLTYDASGALVPGAAESWSVSADGLTYVFTLREARWSNGDPVRADDFVFTFRRLLDPATAAEYASLYYPIRNARADRQGRSGPERARRPRDRRAARSRSRSNGRRPIFSPSSPIRHPRRSIPATSPNSGGPSRGPAIS